jgi:nucleoid DNA-binding protein
MQQLLADYLFQHKQCALPQIGTLQIKNVTASSIFGERKISSPVPVIEFNDDMHTTEHVEAYIALHKNITRDEAARQLKGMADEIQNLPLGQRLEIPNAGKFYKDENDKVGFIAVEATTHFLPQVAAERVVHPNDSHTMLVGETETSTAAMAEYYSEEEPAMKSKWWIFAIASFVVAAAAVGFYASSKSADSFFGAANKIEVGVADSTYRMLP